MEEGGTRSAIAASVLDAKGVSGVLHLPGGFAEWEGAGLPVVRGQENLAGLVLERLDRAAQRAR